MSIHLERQVPMFYQLFLPFMPQANDAVLRPVNERVQRYWFHPIPLTASQPAATGVLSVVLLRNRTVGRPIAIPPSARGLVLQQHWQGLSYQGIADVLAGAGIDASRYAVRRLVKGLPPYDAKH